MTSLPTQGAIKVVALLLFALVLQVGVLDGMRVSGVHPDLLLLVSVLAGLAGGPEKGAIVGFLAGLSADLVLTTTTPLGLSSLSFCLAGFAAGMLLTVVLRTSWFIAPLVAFSGSALGVLGFAAAGALVGRADLIQGHLLTIVAVVASANAVLSLGLWKPVAWASRAPATTRTGTRVSVRGVAGRPGVRAGAR